jgi:plastocyanin
VGCSKSKKKSSSATTSNSTAPATRTVDVDGQADAFNGAFLAYFPNEVTVRPGDTVTFRENWTGEPHSVTLGTLVEAGLSAANAVPQSAPPPPAFASLPVMLPDGPGDANQVAVNPCYIETGALPTDATKPCPSVPQPAFNGHQAYYNSGFLAEGKTWSVKLADDTPTGTYHYYCNLHGPTMTGTITVKAKGESIPSDSDVAANGKAQRDDLIAKLTGTYTAAKASASSPTAATTTSSKTSGSTSTTSASTSESTTTTAAGGPAGGFPIPGYLAGVLDPNVMNAQINEFLPAQITAKVGQKVTWTVVGAHTISFGVPAGTQQAAVIAAPDGTYHGNQKAAAPVGWAGFPQPPQPKPGATTTTTTAPPGPPKAKNADAGKWDGTGERSSGLVLSFPGDNFVSYSLTFTKPGTYTYLCLIHPKMGGTVVVS